MTVARTVAEADLARLKQARHEADRRYNDALTELDSAIQTLPALPERPPLPDEAQITPLNERWDLTRALPATRGGWRGRFAAFVLGLVRPALDEQRAFNAAVVDHLNRNAAQQRAVPEAINATIETLRVEMERLVRFQSRLLLFLQQLTPFVDTKDYEFRGIATRITEDVAEAHHELARTVRGLAAALSGVSDDVLKRWERYEGLRTSVAAMQLTVQAVRREMGRSTAPAASVTAAATSAPGALSSDPLSSHKYVAFEDLFRGDRALIRERQTGYLQIFARSQDVLDVGCGRGEFLQLLAEHGISGRGVDLNHEMVEQCRAAGLDVTEADALSYLREQPDQSIGGLIAAQVVEHLAPDELLALADEAFRVLRPGSAIVLETINVASWSAFFTSYIRDLTHVRPIHPDTLRFVVTASGFADAEIRFKAPLPESEKLQPSPALIREIDLRATGVEGRAVVALAEAFDQNVERLNLQLYAPLDYAVVAWKR